MTRNIPGDRCFSCLRFFRSGTTCVGGGMPMRSRANSLTAVTTRNRRTRFFTNQGDKEWPGQEHQCYAEGARPHLFRLRINPGEQLRHKKNGA